MFKRNNQINFVLPHQFGGFADPDPARTYTVMVTEEVPYSEIPETQETQGKKENQLESTDKGDKEGSDQGIDKEK